MPEINGKEYVLDWELHEAPGPDREWRLVGTWYADFVGNHQEESYHVVYFFDQNELRGEVFSLSDFLDYDAERRLRNTLRGEPHI